MSRYQRKSADPLHAYNPWVVAVDHGHSRPAAPAARRNPNAASPVFRALRRMRLLFQNLSV